MAAWLPSNDLTRDMGLEERLRSATSSNEPDRVREILGLGPSLETINRALSREIRCPNRGTECLQLLLAAGADIEAEDVNRNTPLFQALRCGNIDGALLLLNRGAAINIDGCSKDFPLCLASLWEDTRCLERLVRGGGDVETKNMLGRTPLNFAARCGNYNAANFLLENGAKVDNADNLGLTPLMWAVRKCHDNTQCLKLLLDSGADLEARDYDGFTPLTHAVISCYNMECFEMLLNYGANIDVVDAKGKSLLVLAAERGACIDIMDRLIMVSGGHVDIKDHRGYTALLSALLVSRWEAAELLLRRGASVHIAGEHMTPLSAALTKADLYPRSLVSAREGIILKLLDRRADHFLKENGHKYLNKMVICGYNNVIQKFIANGWAPTVYPLEGHRPYQSLSLLETAILANNIGAARYFIANRFLTLSDVAELPHSLRIQALLHGESRGIEIDDNHDDEEDEDEYNDEMESQSEFPERNKLIFSLSHRPFSLFTLSFVTISSVISLDLLDGLSSSCKDRMSQTQNTWVQ